METESESGTPSAPTSAPGTIVSVNGASLASCFPSRFRSSGERAWKFSTTCPSQSSGMMNERVSEGGMAHDARLKNSWRPAKRLRGQLTDDESAMAQSSRTGTEVDGATERLRSQADWPQTIDTISGLGITPHGTSSARN